MDSVSIIIRAKNEEAFIGKTLEMVRSQKIDIPYEIILVDSGSTDRTTEIAKKFDVSIHQITPESFSFGYALNYGISKSKGEIIVNLSAHCIPVNNQWLHELIKPILNKEVDATFGRQIPIKGLNIFEEVALSKHFPSHNKIKGRVPFSNANCAFTKDMWIERKFDEELPSWEDYLWYLLMKERYKFRYCPESSVYHSHPFSMDWLKRRAFIDGQAFKLIKRKYGIDLLEGLHPTFGRKLRIFVDDLIQHLRLFKDNGYIKQIFLIPAVRLCAYRAYWKGYRSIR